MNIHAPTHGGLFSAGARYPGMGAGSAVSRAEIHCGGARCFPLGKGDLVNLTNTDGGAAALIFAVAADGRDAGADLGLGELPRADGIPAGIDARELTAWIEARGGSAESVRFGRLYDAETPPGERFTFRAGADCVIWVALPLARDAAMNGGGGSLEIEISRHGKPDVVLPEPLGEIRAEFLIDSGTARAYQVREGDYIQIIDIEGRQCSDFMAMRDDALARGVERYIDSTVTRTVVGGAFPGPGLFDKFYDQDMRPLLAVVRDTVGRHDTFALACTARGYEERGFPGHLNCSDNISNAFAPFGIGRRTAWPAINFFFNSWITPADNRLRSDEAWSRPGDHVVMRALTDLVAVSTACPDDVDPINGWNPTDIHVRIYKQDQPIRRAVAHRPFAESEPVMTGESAFHPRTSKLTSLFHVVRDQWLPASYDATRAIGEYWACRNAVTVQDMSSLRKFDVMGPDAEALLQICLSRDIAKLSVNRGVYALMTGETGAVIDDGTLFRLAPDVFRWCCGSDDSARQLKDIAGRDGLKVWIKSLWSSMPNLAVQGPNSRELLKRIVFVQPHQPSLDNLKWFGFTIARLNDREGPVFMLTRTGFTGELGYEIFCGRESALPIWDAVMAAGEDIGVKPMGAEALETIRIEAGLMAAGAEFTPDVDAFEAGLGFAVDMKKSAFAGREALERNAAAPRRKLVGLKFEGNEMPGHGDPVFAGHRQVGAVTSAARSPVLGHAIAMARVAVEHAAVETRLEAGRLDGQIKRLPATVCEIPFVDPKRERARA